VKPLADLFLAVTGKPSTLSVSDCDKMRQRRFVTVKARQAATGKIVQI
jgi:hypothetical protein